MRGQCGISTRSKKIWRACKGGRPRGYLVAGLRERELVYANSVTLHEFYFGNLGGSGKSDGAIAKSLGTAPGGIGRWEEAFRAIGLSLSGGSG